MTDIASGRTESAPLVVRESGLVVETLDRIRLGLPFALRALDVDNGSEFVNESPYGASRLFVNFFQPSFKLAEEHRQGAQVSKRYHPPRFATPSIGIIVTAHAAGDNPEQAA